MTALMVSLVMSMASVQGVCAAASDGAAGNDTIAARCAGLIGRDFSGVMDATTRVVSSRAVDADVKADTPAYCEVRAYVWPQVQFFLWMPLDPWSGRFDGIGCGGACGVIVH